MSPELHENYSQFINNDYNAYETFQYNPFKSDVFSLGMTVLRMMGLDKKQRELIRKEESQRIILQNFEKSYPIILPIIEQMLKIPTEQRIKLEELEQQLTNLPKKQVSYQHKQYEHSITPIEMLLQSNTDKILYYKQVVEIYTHLGLTQEALEQREQLFKIEQETYSNQSAEFSEALLDTGNFLVSQGQFDKAEKYYEQSYIIHKLLYAPNNPKNVEVLIALAEVYQRNNFMKSIQLLEVSLRILTENKIKNDLLSSVLLKLANFYVFEYNNEKVEQFYEKHLQLNEELYGTYHEKVFYSYKLLTEFNFQNKKFEKGFQYFMKAESIIKNLKNGSEVSEEYANLLLLYIDYLYLNENSEKSNQILQKTIDQSLKIMKSIYGEKHIKLIPFIENNYKLANKQAQQWKKYKGTKFDKNFFLEKFELTKQYLLDEISIIKTARSENDAQAVAFEKNQLVQLNKDIKELQSVV